MGNRRQQLQQYLCEPGQYPNGIGWYRNNCSLYCCGLTGQLEHQFTPNQDGASQNIAPLFTSATDLHLVPAGNALLDNMGTPVVGITIDIDCATRNVTTPDIGADEFSAPNCTGATAGTASGSASFCTSGTPSITASGYSNGATTSYQWISSANSNDYPNGGTAIIGQTNPALLTTGTVVTQPTIG